MSTSRRRISMGTCYRIGGSSALFERDGQVVLEGTTWYTHTLSPQWYWSPISNYMIHQIHERVLNHIKRVSEGANMRNWLLWLAAFGFLVALALFPVSSRMTRVASLVLTFVVWFGLIALLWRRRALRFGLLGITLLLGGFLFMPSRGTPGTDVLRADYLAGLQRYEGVKYYWGGENSRGIDCSGLIRRGLIDALARRGIRTFDAGLVRRAIDLWWHDCTARALGEEQRGVTARLLETPSVNTLDHSKILPGDLAVTANGVHIMAYLGDHRWIEADPGIGRVITVNAPSTDNPWFQSPMNIVRWSVLQ